MAMCTGKNTANTTLPMINGAQRLDRDKLLSFGGVLLYLNREK
jgi:hypothetical protein